MRVLKGLDDGQPTNILVVDGAGSSEAVNHSFIKLEIDKEHVIEEKYMTDDLDSGVEDINIDDRPNVARFNEEYKITKDFKFKVGMEFSSLKHVKSAILEHNVLNGRDALSIDISLAKSKPIINYDPSKSFGVRTFIGKEPKVTNSRAFKPLKIVKPTISDHDKDMKMDFIAFVLEDDMAALKKKMMNYVTKKKSLITTTNETELQEEDEELGYED
ncbi:hypothetical protein KIW84_060364 [Lathyrus oleraceus]|uniref:Uncharacterized protein n=1 Tax=Pisum sativum TaxID=3888 RepID=A0A9D4W2U0_PEA|nr:hypothetical protein KIW84_060364 [Pisum sativum]